MLSAPLRETPPTPASARAILGRILTAQFAPREKLTVDRWADTRRVMTEDSSNNPGAWRTSTVPHTRFAMRMMTCPSVRELIFCWGAQTAKTETEINYLGWLSECDPAPCLVVYPNAEDAQDFNKDRVQPAIRASPMWHGLLHGADPRKRERSLGVKQTRFNRCKVYYRGSNSDAKVRSKPCKHRVVDEIDSNQFEYSALHDIRQRAAAWPGGKMLIASTPSFVGQGIEAELARSLEFRYHIPCPRCLKYLELRLSGFKWEGPATKANAEHAGETAHFVCDHCRSRIEEHHKPWMLVRGVWVAEGASIVRVQPEPRSDKVTRGQGDRVTGDSPHHPLTPSPCQAWDVETAQRWRPPPGEEGMELMPGCRIVGAPARMPARLGLRLSAFYSPFYTWSDIAREWCEYEGKPPAKWRNGLLAEGESPTASRVDADQVIKQWLKVETSSEQAKLASRAAGAYRLGECPPPLAGMSTTPVLGITAAIDLQRTHAYITFRGWGKRCQDSWLLWFDTIEAPHGDLATTNRNIQAAVQRTFARVGQQPLGVWRWTIDSGDGVRTADVYAVVRASGGRGLACKGLAGGTGGGGALAVPAREVVIDKWPNGDPMPGGVALLEVNTWHYKGLLLSRLQMPPASAGAANDKTSAPKASPRDLAIGVHRWHWPDPDVDVHGHKIRGAVVDYLEQLTSEELMLINAKAVEKGGASKWVWRRKAERKHNHFLDAEVYGTALAELKMPLLGVTGMPGSGTAPPRTRIRGFRGLRDGDED